MGKKKKVNPRRRPATMADVNRAKHEAQDWAITLTWAIFFTVMRDKEGYGPTRLRRLWEHVNDLSDSIAKGYVSPADLIRTLADEDGITLEGTEGNLYGRR